MNTKIEQKLESAKRIWNKNKGKLAVISTVTVVGLALILRDANRDLEQFLRDNDLLEDYWKFIGADENDIEYFKENPL